MKCERLAPPYTVDLGQWVQRFLHARRKRDYSITSRQKWTSWILWAHTIIKYWRSGRLWPNNRWHFLDGLRSF